VSGVGKDCNLHVGRGAIMNRRDFVVYGTGAMASIGVAALAVRSGMGAGPAIPGRFPSRVIFDDRFQESRAFGDRAGQLGCAVRPISGDVTKLWTDDLQPLWTHGRGTIVGMTTGASLLCIEQLAWNRWMRVVARVDHRFEPHGAVHHRLLLQADALRDAQLALMQPDKWPQHLATMLVSRIGARRSLQPIESVATTSSTSTPPTPTALTSWVIEARQLNQPARAPT